MHNQFIRDEISYLYNAAYACREMRQGFDGAWQIAPFQASIPYSDGCIEKLYDLQKLLTERFPDLLEFGRRRAERAFVKRKHSITKPSYVERLYNFSGQQGDQFENLALRFVNEPSSGGLVFSIFTPEDIVNRKRPGFVPCLVSGSFLLHKGEMHLNAFFRSQSVVEFGIFDLIFLRELQVKFLDRCRSLGNFDGICLGPLNLLLGRVIIQRRVIRKGKSFLKRDDILNQWIAEVEGFMMR